MMKLFLIALLTSSAFANDVNEISGTFFSEQEIQPEISLIDVYSVNTFPTDNEVSRIPASESFEKHSEDQSVNEITGTFQ